MKLFSPLPEGVWVRREEWGKGKGMEVIERNGTGAGCDSDEEGKGFLGAVGNDNGVDK